MDPPFAWMEPSGWKHSLEFFKFGLVKRMEFLFGKDYVPYKFLPFWKTIHLKFSMLRELYNCIIDFSERLTVLMEMKHNFIGDCFHCQILLPE